MSDDGLAERLEQSFEASGLKKKDLAEKVGVSQATIGKILKGNIAKDAYFGPLAAALGVAEGWLRTGDADGADDDSDAEAAPLPDTGSDAPDMLNDVLEVSTRDLTAEQLALLMGMPLAFFEYD